MHFRVDALLHKLRRGFTVEPVELAVDEGFQVLDGIFDLRREQIVRHGPQRHRDLREILFDRLGTHVCARCGFSDKRALQFDHLNGGGSHHRRSLPSGSAYYRTLVEMSPAEFRQTFQVLCANCNVIKRDERQEWRWRHAGEVAAQED